MLSTSSNTLLSSLPKLALDGSNWIVWKARMTVFLGAKRYTQYIDGSKSPPSKPKPLADGADEKATEAHEKESEKYLEWFTADTETKHWILSTIPEFFMVKNLNCATAADLWKAICTEHEKKTKTTRMEMTRRIHNERCTDADDVRDHFVKMVRLREELAATGEALDDDNFSSILTNSLPESYGNVISTAYTAATITGTTPTVDQIIAVIEAEYSRRQITNGGLPGSVALFSNQQRPSSSKKKPKHKPVCTNTKCRFRHNHEFKDCRSVGGPKHGQDLPRTGNQQKFQGDRNAKQMMRANVAEEIEIEHAFNVTTSLSVANVIGNTKTTRPSERVEVYDSGASCHMSPYIDAFTEFTFIEPKPISAADNRTFKAVGKGTMKVIIPNGDRQTAVQLSNVLYAPTIAFTLISLSRADTAGYTTVTHWGQRVIYPVGTL